MSIFQVDTKGFGQAFADRPIHRMIEELISNALDENVTQVDVTYGRGRGGDYTLTVTDDSPTGFEDLKEVYTEIFSPRPEEGRCYQLDGSALRKWVIARCQRWS